MLCPYLNISFYSKLRLYPYLVINIHCFDLWVGGLKEVKEWDIQIQVKKSSSTEYTNITVHKYPNGAPFGTISMVHLYFCLM